MASFQGVVTGTGENSEFGEVFKMMKAEEVSIEVNILTLLLVTRNKNKHVFVGVPGNDMLPFSLILISHPPRLFLLCFSLQRLRCKRAWIS